MAIRITDSAGHLIVSVDDKGNVRDQAGRFKYRLVESIGSSSHNRCGIFDLRSDSYIASVDDNGIARDEYGNIKYKIYSTGRIRDWHGALIGYFDSDGALIDFHGYYISKYNRHMFLSETRFQTLRHTHRNPLDEIDNK